MANQIVSPLPGIAALPLNTARQIGSGQVLIDTSSVVKELIDNALDARAKSVFVDITANTIDSIQVKDDGHGIPAEDRTLVCRRYCTSKIKDFEDLKNVGGRWLGFRGEALSSMAELSGTLSVTTRVEGEPVAVKLKYDRHGELIHTERYSHPVGTTVKATQFFEIIPVRKQTAIKNAAKCLTKIRRLMQAYALAWPAVRFRLHVLKATNIKHDFIYAPKAGSNVEYAVLGVIGKECALQCGWTGLESDEFEIHAFLPKPRAAAPKITNQGAFISIDSRPVSSSRGTIKKIVSAFREMLRKSNSSLATVKDPFFYMNIICPPGSYDPNIEPAKDDVMFTNEDMVLSAIDNLLRSYYPEATSGTKDNDSLMTDRSRAHKINDSPTRTQALVIVNDDASEQGNEEPAPDVQLNQSRWRFSMYGTDEEDTEFFQGNQLPLLEEEEGSRATIVSNPWTIARMNAPIKVHSLVANGQLLSPAKSQVEISVQPSSPTPIVTPVRESQVEPLTPRTSSTTDEGWSSLHSQLDLSTACFTQRRHGDVLVDPGTGASMRHDGGQLSMSPVGAHHMHHELGNSKQADRFSLEATNRANRTPRSSRVTHVPPFTTGSARPSSRRSQKKQQSRSDGPVPSSIEGAHDTWFGQPMRGSNLMPQPRFPLGRKKQAVSISPQDVPSSPDRLVLQAQDRTCEGRLQLKDNTDIRDFFRRNAPKSVGYCPSFTPTNVAVQLSRRQGQLPVFVDGVDQSFTSGSRGRLSLQNTSRASSAEPQLRSHKTSTHQANAHRPSSAGSERSISIQSAGGVYRHDRLSNHARDMMAHFKAYQDQETASLDRAAGVIRGRESRIAPARGISNRSRLQRRRTTDGLRCAVSTKLPLERPPSDYLVHNLILDVHFSMVSIVYSSRKLDMSRNSLEWGYAAQEVYGAFAEPVTAREVMEWVITLDGALNGYFERLPDADTRSMLHEAIQRCLDARKADEATDVVEIGDLIVNEEVDEIVHVDGSERAATSKRAESDDFDMSQFVEFDVAELGDEEMDSVPAARKLDDGFGDDVEDDMLLDL